MVSRGRLWDCVVLDLNTQVEFCDPSGTRSVRNSNQLVSALRDLMGWARAHRVPMISSVDSHRDNEINAAKKPEYCLDGTRGQRKLGFTLLQNAVTIEGDNTLSVPCDLFRNHQQVIFPKRTMDLLGNPKADLFVTQLRTTDFILCGVSLEYSVRSLGLALLARGRKVYVVREACGYWTESDADLSLRLLVAKGATIISVEELRIRDPMPACRFMSKSRNGRNGHNGTNGSKASSTRNGNGLHNGNGQPTLSTDESLSDG